MRAPKTPISLFSPACAMVEEAGGGGSNKWVLGERAGSIWKGRRERQNGHDKGGGGTRQDQSSIFSDVQEGKRKHQLRFPLAFAKAEGQPVGIHTVLATLADEDHADALIAALKEHMPS